MKKFLAFLLSLTLVFTLVACGGGSDPRDPEDEDLDLGEIDEENSVIIGSEEFSGEFIYWGGSSSYDVQIRESINGSSLIATDKDTGEFIPNETILTEDSVEHVEDVAATEFDEDDYDDSIFDEDGNKTYEFEIKDDLQFSDGEDITAEDYAFAIKMQSAYAVGQAGHTALVGGEDLVGFDAWSSGESDEFEGVEVVDDTTIRLTIDSEQLPYFYELSMVAYGPQPEHVYTNDGEYEFLTADEFEDLEDDETHIGEYIYEMLSSPPVSSGPYVLDHYEQDQYVRMSRNENYAGDYRGKTPSIENVIVRVVPSSTDIEHLINEEIDVLTGLVEERKIDRALDEDHLYDHHYRRNGFGALFIQTDFGHSQDYRVRQAIAYMIDRDGFVERFLGGYGDTTHAPYGFGQWMLEESSIVPDELEQYSEDMDKVHELLDEAGYTKDENGDDWESFEESGTRYNEEGEELTLGWMGTDSDFSDILSNYLTDNMEEAGVNFNSRQAGFDQLLDQYYYAYELDDDEREYNMFNLATSYTETYDPYNTYHSDRLGTTYNTSQFEDSPESPQVDDFTEQAGHDFSWIVDHEDNDYDDKDSDEAANEFGLTVDELTERMRRLNQDERDQFREYWEALSLRLNRLLPVLPLYSNEYYNFANQRIEGLELGGFWDWQQNIVDWEI
ncbi:MAG: ABC transporter substrate-binding protein, partial [Bacillota bacterium]